MSSRFSCATALLRRQLFDRFSYDQTLSSYEDWGLSLRLSVAGHRFLVTNQIQFHYRARRGSMLSTMTPERHVGLLARMFERLPAPLPPSVRLFPTLAWVTPASQGLATRPVARRPLRYDVADELNLQLKRLPRLHRTLKGRHGQCVPAPDRKRAAGRPPPALRSG